MHTQKIKVLVGSKNPVKVDAAQAAFSQVFSHCIVCCDGETAPSGVSDQPMTSEETKEGAVNRVNYSAVRQPGYDYYVAMEGGVDMFDYGAATFAYVAIKHDQQVVVGRGANLPLPETVYQALQAGEELGDVMDRLFNTQNIKQQGGAISLLTKGLETRQSNYQQALVLALAPFINAALYEG